MNRIISFIVLICLVTGLLFVGPPGALAAESPASAISIPQAANYTAISAGYNFTLALKDNGTVAAWGDNSNGQCTVPEALSGVKAIAAGYYHSVALKEDGTVVAWGYNGYNQCKVPTDLSGVKAIAAGQYATVALKEDGTIVAWGYNGNGQCTAPTGLSGVRTIATGSNHTVALKEDGTVVSWGYNGYGQCTVPTGLSGVKAIAAGSNHTVALKDDGTVVSWGYNGSGQCNVPTGLSGVNAIVAGDSHAVALKEDGTIVAWGYNGYGQCNVPTGLSGVKAIAAKGHSTVVLKEDGTIISFGDQNYIIPSTKASSANAVTPSNAEFNTSIPESITVKMYADGSNKLTDIKNGANSLTSSDYSISGSAITINKTYLSSCFASSDKLSLTFDFDNGVDPVLSIEKNDGTKNSIYKSISSGYNFTLALKKDGTVVALGDNGNGQCNVPAGLSGVKAVAAGYYHSVALKEDGTVVAWGYNSHGECNVPAGLSGVKAISAGQYHTVALKEDGTVVAWGYNTYAQCASPACLYGVKDIVAGGYFTVALKTDGTVAAWGSNDNGQCNVPADLSDVKAISAGQNHVIALKTDGTVVAWGYNGYNQCNVPSGLSGVKAISAGYYHTAALKEDGTLITWGYNGSGQCSVPAGLSSVKAVSARYNSTVALKDDGTIISFGNQNYIIPYSKPLSANSLNIYSTEFDSLNPSDISVKTFASDKNKLISVKNGTDSLTGSDYSVSGSTVTINKSYLSSYFANASKLSLTFDFDNGNDPVLAVEKNDGGKDSIYKDIKSGYGSTIALKTDGTVAAWGDNSYGECNIPAGLSGVKAIAAGQYYFVALKEDGTVTAWGYNSYNQCNVPSGLSNVKAIAAGQNHTLALKEDGTVTAWGYSDYGQCMIPSGLSGVRAIAAGQYYSVALKEDGTVVAWGYNYYGQCNIPAGLSGVKSIAAGDNHIVAVKEDGTVIAWGYNGNGQCNVPSGLSGIKAVAAGDIHTVALKEDGTITAWGYNGNGECAIPAGLSDVKSISAGYRYTSVLKKDGTIIAFGYKNFTIPSSKPLSVNSITPYISEFDTSNPNDIAIKTYTSVNKLISIKNGSDLLAASDYSVSGSAVTINKSYLSSYFTKASKILLTFDFDNGNDPVLTIEKANVSAQNFKAAAVGQYHTVALKGDGTVTAWGYNGYGQCTIPAGLSGVKAVAAGDNYSAALKTDGTVAAWGYNGYGQCNIPKGLSGVKAIAASNNFIVALKEDGTVAAWGYNGYGQCTVPSGLSGIKAIAAGLYHTVALKEDGTVVTWGYNNYGQCTIPSGLSGVKAIAAGDYHTVALKEDGTIVVWGYNNNGQCNVPSGLSSVKAVSADANHTMALKEDGTVIAWGDNDYDQCKNFNGLTNVKAISTGQYHSIALKENGTAFAWGYNNYGECAVPLGAGIKAISAGSHTAVLKEDGTLNIWGENGNKECNIPDGLSSVKAVAVGNNHTVALKEDGTVAAWGYNGYGQCNVPAGLSGVKAVAAGAHDSAALKEDGTVVAWGYNGYGQCKVPEGLSGVKAIACGYYHTVALKEDGTVVTWGYNGYGQCTIPDGLSGVKAISAGNNHTVALKEDGTVVAWGYNGNNQCTIPSGLSGVKAISAGDNYTVALKEDGTIVSWGSYTAPAGVSEVKAISGTTVLKEDGTVIDLRNNYIIPFPKAASTNLINPTSAGFDSLNPLDVRIDIDAGAGKLVAIKNGNDALTSSDYTVSGSAVIISKNYLLSILTKTVPLGQKMSLTFDFDNGSDPVLTIQKVSISVDKTPPSIIVIEPVDSSVLGPSATINVRASDNFALSSIKLQYSLNSTDWKDIGKQTTDGSATFTWDTTALTSSSVKVRAIAVDTSGNESTDSPVRTYTVDTTGPSKVTGLTASTPSAVGVTLHWNDVSDQDFKYFQVERKDSASADFKSIGTVSTTLGMNVTGLVPGTTYLFRVAAYDKCGNRGTSSDEITVTTPSDSQAPVITSLNPKPGRYSNSINLYAYVTDDAGVTSFKFQKSNDKVNWTDIVTLTNSYTYYSYNFDISKEPEGITAIRGIAYDSSGNKSSSENSYIEYYIDHTAPQIPTQPAIEASTSQLTLSWEKAADADLAYYKLYRAEGSYASYTCIASNLTSLYYVDSNVQKDVVYYYQLSAVDQAGNESLLSKNSTSKLVDDKEIPVIQSVSEVDNATLPANPTIRVLASDNYKVAKVTMEYQSGTSWIKIGDVALNSKGDVASFKWDTTGLSEGKYTVRVTAVDASGNAAAPVIRNYTLNLIAPKAPVLSVTPGNWNAALSWTSGSESDLAGFRIYRSLTSGSGYGNIGQVTSSTASWTNEQLKPRTTYYYKVEAIDAYGNSSFSNEVSVTPLSVDTYAPVAEAGDNQQTIEGTGIQFDGTKSTDNDAIKSYEWDFGDGEKSTLGKPVHTYAKSGEYTVKLAVTDFAGNTASDTLSVKVLAAGECGALEVKVLDDSTGNIIPDASVVVKFGDASEMKYYTDSNGLVKASGKSGSCTVYAFKTDYKPVQTNVELKDSGNVTIRLVKGKLIDGELTVKRMKLEEIVAAGIDVSKPENQWVYKFETHLAFTNTTVAPIVVNGYGGQLSGFTPFTITSSSSGGTSTSYVYPYVVPVPKHPEVAPNVYYLVIPGEAKWLKEFFEVGLTMINTSDPSTDFAVTDSVAKLNIPDGLTFMTTTYSSSPTIAVGILKPGETKEVKWVVRGDKKGMYSLDADFNGILQPFKDAVSANFKTSSQFRVWGDDALKMHIDVQDRADKGYPYHVRFGIENVSDTTLYNASIALKDDTKQNYIYAPDQRLENAIKELPAGKTIWLDSILIPSITGKLDLSKSYTLKTGSNDVNIASDMTSHSAAQNYPGTAPVLKETHNADKTVTLSWGAVSGATGYRIYYVRKDLYMSGAAEKVADVDASKTSITIPETELRNYVITTLTAEGEVLRHAITGFNWCDAAGAPVITVDPMEITVGKSNDVMITVNKNGYPVSGGTVDIGSYVKGQVLDNNGQAKVAVTPTTAGDIVVNAYDINHNLLTSKIIKAVAAATTDSSIAPSTDIFNTLSPVDIKTTMILNGNTLVNIMSGAAPLSKSDYSVNGNVVTINKGFFSYYFSKFKNNCTLTFKFSSGKDAIFTVKPIFDALLTPDTANFDPSNQADVKVTMALSGNTLVSIMSGAASLTKSDYSVNGNVATISKGFFSYYFSKFSNNCSLKFVFSDGKYAFLTVKPYANANDPSISPNTTTCNIVSPEAIQVTMTLNGSILGSIMNGSAPLTKYDYSVNGNVVTINKGYLAYYFGKFPKYNCNLTFKFSSGKDILLTIKPSLPDSSISPVEASYSMTTPQSISVALTLNGNKLTSVKDSAKTLSEGTDYVVSGSSVLLKTDYLSNLPIGDTTLTFNFDAGKSSSLKITVIGEIKDSTISPDTTTCSVTTPESIKVTMALNGNTLVNIMNGAAPLTKYDYSVDGNVVTINKSYFVYYFGRFPKYNCTLTFKFSNGKDAVFTVKPAQ